ncbi:retropepsin-like domain-containing protein [Fulvivirga ulvae]|uniref:aspartyl protease family protein n=1 Tax=Fulvivirga ulvae TaxID=2904245 RepID=UPI001F3F1AB9|nr:aspartyl protease family protein [Fulvivirga ulvae]UII31699.1 retropepsin-like domain-containing protein [Fulvivirga ulvae]
MNKILFVPVTLSVLLIFQSCNPTEKPETSLQVYEHLDSLYRNKAFFKLKDGFNKNKALLGDRDRLVIQAFTDAIFNNREASNAAIDSVMSHHNASLSDSLKLQLLETKINNSVFIGRYYEAFEATKAILALGGLSNEEKDDHENTLKIYDALKNSPGQMAIITESTLPIGKDMAGLSRIPVTIGNTEQQAVFDTGANLSVITDSLAIKYGLTILGETFKVTALTGNEVDSHIALADSLKIGNTILKNVVFLVFPESSLSFPSIGYQIDLIIGFLVIHALREVSIVKNASLHIPETTGDYSVTNMALDFLTPIVAVEQDSRTLPFTFDTGASSTQLYKSYFNLHKDAIVQSGKPDTVSLGGAGGAIKTAIYKTTFSAAIAQQPFSVDSAQVFYDHDLKKDIGMYGNLGQDVFQQFDTLTMNFEKMFLKLE